MRVILEAPFFVVVWCHFSIFLFFCLIQLQYHVVLTYFWENRSTFFGNFYCSLVTGNVFRPVHM